MFRNSVWKYLILMILVYTNQNQEEKCQTTNKICNVAIPKYKETNIV